jgi:hypothetical protein
VRPTAPPAETGLPPMSPVDGVVGGVIGSPCGDGVDARSVAVPERAGRLCSTGGDNPLDSEERVGVRW